MRAESCKTQADIDREDRAFRREVDECLAENDLQAVPVGAVVIDPEDREQVERFVTAFVSEATARGHYVNGEHDARVRSTQAALRSLIAPPKPPEPTGLGAVVEDNEGRKWVRVHIEAGCAWRIDNHVGFGAAGWSNVPAVKVLNQGVTS